MNNKLGFKLWIRKKVFQTKQLIGRHKIFSNLNTLLQLVIAGVGIYFASVANRIGNQSKIIAQRQLTMQETDTSQQSQLNKLMQIVIELKAEHATSDKISAATNRLNDASKIQLEIVDQQLKLSKRLESKSEKNDTLEQNANMLSLIVTFNNLFDFKSSGTAYGLYFQPIPARAQIVSRIRKLLEDQLQNKYILNNNYLRFVWVEFYLYTDNLESMYNVYDLGTRSEIKSPAQNDSLAKDFSASFLDFVNKMLKPKNQFLKMYTEQAQKDFEKNPVFKY